MNIFDMFKLKQPNPDRPIPTIDDLRHSTYAIFTNNGVGVDLDAYLQTPEGRQAAHDAVKNLRVQRAPACRIHKRKYTDE